MFPETSIECRDLLSALGFGAFTIEVRGYLFTGLSRTWRGGGAHAAAIECPRSLQTVFSRQTAHRRQR